MMLEGVDIKHTSLICVLSVSQVQGLRIRLHFDGYDSYLTVLDNGVGMTPAEIREAMRFGSLRDYEQDDLGKFGLGLKTSSLSQCDSLTVSSRNSQKKVQIHSYSWDMDHINKVDQWEILLYTLNV